MNSNFFYLLIVKLFIILNCFGQSPYQYSIDISKVANDEIKVLLKVPTLKSEPVTFCFPAMVPGTYSVYDFGRFVKDLKVKGKNKEIISFTKININEYKVSDGSKIEEISYSVEDSWDTKDTGEVIFEPAGTKFNHGKHFILNNQGVFGYFKGLEKTPIEIEVVKPENFYPATGLSNIKFGKQKDIFKIKTYHELIDSPILYSVPDTTTIDVGGSKVLISVVSPNKKISSSFISRTIYDILSAQQKYLGGKLPVDKYAFLFYFTDSITRSGNAGALEHSYSSMYVLFESDTDQIKQVVKDVAAHEFFHIVTPLSIHSEEIGEFDFNNPKMSMHLWLYEGMTEYAAHHVQVMNGLIELDDFFETVREKINTSTDYFNDTLPFTKMSKGCLNEYKSQYANVYEKGALISMCLDILLNHYSKGNYNTRKLLFDLSKKFGKDQSFKDDLLFDQIEQLTYPEIRIFLNDYVAGNKKLPFKEVFRKAGILFNSELTENEITLGGFELGYNAETNNLIIESIYDLNQFGVNMGYKEGDELVTFQGKKINLQNANDIFYDFLENAKEGELCTVEVMRKDKKGKASLKKLTSKIIKIKTTYKNVIQPDPLATDEELNVRKIWLQGL